MKNEGFLWISDVLDDLLTVSRSEGLSELERPLRDAILAVRELQVFDRFRQEQEMGQSYTQYN